MKSSYNTSINGAGADEERESLINQPLLQDTKNFENNNQINKQYSGCGDLEGPKMAEGLPEEVTKRIRKGMFGKLDEMD
jgi:hypothetical protein